MKRIQTLGSSQGRFSSFQYFVIPNSLIIPAFIGNYRLGLCGNLRNINLFLSEVRLSVTNRKCVKWMNEV